LVDGRDDRLCAAHRPQRGSGITSGTVEVVVSAKRACQFLLVAPAIDRDGAKPKACGELDGEMTETADAVNRDQIACAGSRVAQRVERRHPCTQQRRRLD
jgi:hypothetical protein